jgi:LAO/AO transport system kinase
MSKNFLNKNLSKKRSNFDLDFEVLRKGILQQDRKTIAKALTLVENVNRTYDLKLLDFLSSLPKPKQSLRLAVSGPPGVGKSTIIEKLGLHFIGQGKKVAVLAIDPSSESGKGSVLGDKTRMTKLSTEANAFVRPSPNNLELGGVRKSTFDSLRICEAAGFDIIFIETVGVGQSEIDAWHITDLFLLLMNPAGGDDLQGIKRGITEKADIIIINKSDGKFVSASEIIAQHLKRSSKLLSLKDSQEAIILRASAINNEGTDKIIEVISKLNASIALNDEKVSLRKSKETQWFKNQMNDMIFQMMNYNQHVSQQLSSLLNKLDSEKLGFYEALKSLNTIITSLSVGSQKNI